MTAAPDLTDNPYAIAQCAECEYDLTGLPPVKHCPECGRAYDGSELQIWGDGSVQEPWVPWIGAAGGLCGLMYGNPWIQANVPFARYTVVVFIAFAFWLWWRRRENKRRYGTMGGGAQMIVCAGGVAQRHGSGPFELHPWSQLRSFALSRRYRWRLSRTKAIQPSWVLVFSSRQSINAWGWQVQPKRGERVVHLSVMFEGSESEVAALERAVRSLRTQPDQRTT